MIQAIGLVDEVAEGARQEQGFGGEGAGGRAEKLKLGKQEAEIPSGRGWRSARCLNLLGELNDLSGPAVPGNFPEGALFRGVRLSQSGAVFFQGRKLGRAEGQRPQADQLSKGHRDDLRGR